MAGRILHGRELQFAKAGECTKFGAMDQTTLPAAGLRLPGPMATAGGGRDLPPLQGARP